MRINQYVANASGLSRRAADAAVKAGRVTLDGRAAEVGEHVSLHQVVTLDGTLLAPKVRFTYIALHKPVGFISSHARQGAAPTLYELLPPEHQALRIAGRLDRDSSGLIVLSDDGNFIQALSHPNRGKYKQYDLTLDKPISLADQERLTRGVILKDGPSKVQVLRTKGTHLTVQLHDGRNRQLRRTFGALGRTIYRLHRTHVGIIKLADLASGQWRPLQTNEKTYENPIA